MAKEQFELVFALVGPVGTDFDWVETELKNGLTIAGYDVSTIRLSTFLQRFQLADDNGNAIELVSSPRDKHIDSHMDAGNALRRSATYDALALLAIQRIQQIRFENTEKDALPLRVDELRAVLERHASGEAISSSEAHALLDKLKNGIDDPPTARRAYILRSVKHPDEVYTLRRVYQSGFYLIGVHSDPAARQNQLALDIAKDYGRNENSREFAEHAAAAERLIRKDERQPEKHGQRLQDTFHLADFFVSRVDDEVLDDGEERRPTPHDQIQRIMRLVMGSVHETPSREEYLMFLAHAAATRSGSLARQVGAVLATRRGEVLACGSNEVPRSGGGQYWPGHYDHRDINKPRDFSNEQEERIVKGVLDEMKDRKWLATNVDLNEAIELFKSTEFGSIVEFSRSTHAEMEALQSAGRVGISTSGQDLYTTTFPCHECAKLIIGAGLSRVIYIEPYPKSLAIRLHEDSMTLDLRENRKCNQCNGEHKILFRPFIGVGPRRYLESFSATTPEGKKIERKNERGEKTGSDEPSPRVPLRPLSYLDLERKGVNDLLEALNKATTSIERPAL